MRFGSIIRAVRIRRGWRQSDLARVAKVSQVTVSRLERGHLDGLPLRTIRRIATALDVRVDLTPRWRAGELDRLINAGHAELHELVARWFADQLPAWVLRPEVSFAVFGERGVIDILAWHAARRALLVIELKTDVVDVNSLVGGVDRKRRLATGIARDLGWEASSVSVWVLLSDSATNRRRIAAHGAMLRAAFPADGRTIRSWLRDPDIAISGLSIWRSDTHLSPTTTPVRRVRRRST